ncbi:MULTISPECIES: Tat pathway signal protein [unclassified Methylobacterium]|uniref:Tat pathway signal protein n=1 Tax=unclassified Methylobacterium TaxID=2615210 RepID=UPI001FF07693|nr:MULTISPECIES: Tat pathway signal protein [unclassified Methylobacterium]
MAEQMLGRGVPLYRRRIGRLALDTAASAGLSLVLAASLVVSATAQDAGSADKAAPIKLQLNRLEPADDSCRATIVVDNSRGTALKSYKLDLFAFDTDGIAQKRVAAELGPIPARKTTVKIFNFPGIACPKLSRVLLSDVLACEGGDVTRESCLERTETETKANVPFDR